MTRRASRGPWRIFRWPIALAAVSFAGLLVALLGDGWEDVLSWLLLGSLPVVLAIAILRSDNAVSRADLPK